MSENNNNSLIPDKDSRTAQRRQVWRGLKDRIFKNLMGFGGISVIIAILLIFFYLFYVVMPLFGSARVEEASSYTTAEKLKSSPLILATEEYREIGLSVDGQGNAIFFKLVDGSSLGSQALVHGQQVTSVAKGVSSQHMIALGLAQGEIILARYDYQISYPDNVRKITPKIEFPLGSEPLQIDGQDRAIIDLALQSDGEQTTMAAITADQRLLLARMTAEESLLGDEVEIQRETGSIDLVGDTASMVRMDVDQEELYIVTDTGYINYYDISALNEPVLLDRVAAVADGQSVSALEFLSGGISVLVGDTTGKISQWFPVRDINKQNKLQKVRSFKLGRKAITAIAPEAFRKGFAAADAQGRVGLFHTTADRTLYKSRLSKEGIVQLEYAPRGNALVALDQAGELKIFDVHNKHPEVSWASLWNEVWYESRTKEEYIWQSSSASNDFEPKFSLTPLTFGTIKAAFYAMMFAVPLAILGAVFTAYFMSPQMRNKVKPTIEIMEALPTVILGFLAGLWLAPLVEKNLPGVFLIFFLVPLMILLTAFAWSRLPSRIRQIIPEGWEAALLIPVVILAMTISMFLSLPVEQTFFGGDMPHWVTKNLGLDFDQRNSLVVGIAMGFAVIPTIFSISEDAIFSVPKHLTVGSLALGATTWQTLVKVVILTASPGIFSALMIGLGRAVGETMIVLMATGNTPIMDFNIFQGFRALSANIAVEMPESEVGSTHFRILFLAALVLFVVTFIFNTIAELVRQRLREKYSNL